MGIISREFVLEGAPRSATPFQTVLFSSDMDYGPGPGPAILLTKYNRKQRIQASAPAMHTLTSNTQIRKQLKSHGIPNTGCQQQTFGRSRAQQKCTCATDHQITVYQVWGSIPLSIPEFSHWQHHEHCVCQTMSDEENQSLLGRRRPEKPCDTVVIDHPPVDELKLTTHCFCCTHVSGRVRVLC